MRRIFFLLAMILFTSAPTRALTGPPCQGNIYAPDTSYQGKIDSRGNIYAPDTSYRGKIDSRGNIYAPDTSYRGRIVPNGNSQFLPFELETRKARPN